MSSKNEKESSLKAVEALLNDGKSTKEKVYKDVEIVKEGNKIILPEGMSYKQGREWLNRQEQAEERMISYNASMKAYPTDGAYALYRALKRMFGFVDLVNNGPSEDNPPQTIEVKLPEGKSINVPWGRMQIPGMDKECFIETGFDNRAMEFCIFGNIRKKHESIVNEVVDLTRDILMTESIYQGRAIKLDLTFMMDESGRTTIKEPEFIDTSRISENDILLSDLTLTEYAPVLMRITRTDECETQGIRLKHGALLAGPYGTGKTLLANYTAKKAVENKWTFIYLKDVQQLAHALRVSELYGKVVLFAEDVDKATKGERSDNMNRILNTLDGVDTKKFPIITILTTNHLENINKAFLRAGRIDSLIVMDGLESDNALKFIQKFTVNAKGESLLIDGEDYMPAAIAMRGIVPAFASEVIGRAKTYAMTRGGSTERISCRDLELAVESYRKHVALTENKKVYTKAEMVGMLSQALHSTVYNEEVDIPQDILKVLEVQGA